MKSSNVSLITTPQKVVNVHHVCTFAPLRNMMLEVDNILIKSKKEK
jgi:hypothetical protein